MLTDTKPCKQGEREAITNRTLALIEPLGRRTAGRALSVTDPPNTLSEKQESWPSP